MKFVKFTQKCKSPNSYIGLVVQDNGVGDSFDCLAAVTKVSGYNYDNIYIDNFTSEEFVVTEIDKSIVVNLFANKVRAEKLEVEERKHELNEVISNLNRLTEYLDLAEGDE